MRFFNKFCKRSSDLVWQLAMKIICLDQIIKLCFSICAKTKFYSSSLFQLCKYYLVGETVPEWVTKLQLWLKTSWFVFLPILLLMVYHQRLHSPHPDRLVRAASTFFTSATADHWRTSPPRARARLFFLSDPSPIIGYACHSLTDALPFSKLVWCDPGMWRYQLQTCWGCYCCWCWLWGSYWQQFVANLEAELWS